MSNKTTDFFGSWNSDTALQKDIFTEELSNRLGGENYNRERDLPKFLPDVKVRPMRAVNPAVSDAGYTIWVIGELKGKIATQIAHQDLFRMFPEYGGYSVFNRELHIDLIGALTAETKHLTTIMKNLETQNEGENTHVIKKRTPVVISTINGTMSA